MLNEPLTTGNLLLINAVTLLPIFALVGKGVWYLSRMVHQHDQMWVWFNGPGGRRRTDVHEPEDG